MTDSPAKRVANTYDIFISYHHRCTEPVQRLAMALEAVGVRHFLDGHELEPWADITATPLKALTHAKALLVWYSTDYPHSRPCQKILALAVIAHQQAGKMPVRQRILLFNAESDDAHIYPVHLRGLQFGKVNGFDQDAQFAKLAQTIHAHCHHLQGSLGDGGLSPPCWHNAYSGGNRGAVRYFIGRHRPLWDIHDSLHQTGALQEQSVQAVVISGLGGQGKSLLAQEYAIRFGAAYPGGVFWLNAAGVQATDNPEWLNENSPLKRQLAVLLGQLQTAPAACPTPETLPVPQLLARMGEALGQRGKPFLWIVDDLPDGLNDAAFRQWLAPATDQPLGRTLVTTRTQAYHDKARLLLLPPLEPEAAYSLLIRKTPPVNPAEQLAAQALAAALGHHALAVWVAGDGVAHEARQSGQPYQDFRQRLAHPCQDVLDTAAQLSGELPNGHAPYIIATLRHSLDLLDNFGQDAVTLATLLSPTPMPAALLADTFSQYDSVDEETGRWHSDQAITNLLAHSLAEERHDGLWLHPLVLKAQRPHSDDGGLGLGLYRALLATLYAKISDCLYQGRWQPFLAYCCHAHALLAIPPMAGLANDRAVLEQWIWLGNYLGDMELSHGGVQTALSLYKTSQRLVAQQAAQSPDDSVWQCELAASYDKIGDVFRDQGNLAGALAGYHANLAISAQLAAQDPGHTGWQHNLSVNHIKIGDVLRKQGNLAGTLANYRASLDICAQLATQEPHYAGWLRDLSVSLERVGDVLRDQGDLDGALASFNASLAICAQLERQDPGHTGWQRDLSVSHDRLGDVFRDQGDLDGALANYRSGLAIALQLAEQDLGNLGWRHDLYISHIKIADALSDLGDLAEATASYRASLDIAVQLTAQDPGHTGWQADLAFSHDNIGDMLRNQGDLAGALASYRAGLAVTSQLVAQNPDDARWQADLAFSHAKMGWALRHLQQPDLALAELETACALLNALLLKAPEHGQWRQALEYAQRQIAELERHHGEHGWRQSIQKLFQ